MNIIHGFRLLGYFAVIVATIIPACYLMVMAIDRFWKTSVTVLAVVIVSIVFLVGATS